MLKFHGYLGGPHLL